MRQGKLDRTVRAITRADELCPVTATETHATLVTSLVELGRYAEARAVADRIDASAADPAATAREAAREARARMVTVDRAFDNTDAAKAPMRALYTSAAEAMTRGDHRKAKENFLAAWAAWRPNGQALRGAGLAARALGEEAESRRLFDRAIVDLEKATRSKLELGTLGGFTGGIQAVRWASAGGLLAVAHGSVVSLIRDTTLLETYRLEHGAVVTAIAMSPDGRQLASAAYDGIARLWSTATGEETLQKSVGQNVEIGFTRGGEAYVVMPRKSEPRVVSLGTGSAVTDRNTTRCAELAADPRRECASSADGAALATFSGEGAVIWSARTGESLKAINPREQMTSLALSPDGKLLALSSANLLGLWSAETAERVRALGSGVAFSGGLAFSPDGKTLASAAADETVRLWSVATGAETHRLGAHWGQVEAVAYSPDGASIASSSDELIYLWHPATGESRKILRGHTARVLSIAFSPDGKSLASSSDDRTVRRWSVSGELLETMEGLRAPAQTIAFGAAGRTLALASSSSVELRPVGGGKGTTLDKRATAVAFDPSGKTLAIGTGYDVELRSVDDDAWIRTLEGHSEPVASIVFSPDGKLLVSASRDGRARIWSLTTGAELHVLRGHTGPVHAAAFSPRGDAVATGSADGTVRLWSAATGAQLHELRGHDGYVRSVAWSPDGNTVASGAKDGTTRVWSAATGEQLFVRRPAKGLDAAYAFTADGHLELFGDIAASRKYSTCRVGPLSFSIELCEERFVVPGLVARVMRGDRSYRDP